MPPYSLPSDEEEEVVIEAPRHRVVEQNVQVNIAALRPGIYFGPHANATVERIIPAHLGYCLICHANNHETFQCINARRFRLAPTTITSNQHPPRDPPSNEPRGPSSAV